MEWLLQIVHVFEYAESGTVTGGQGLGQHFQVLGILFKNERKAHADDKIAKMLYSKQSDSN